MKKILLIMIILVSMTGYANAATKVFAQVKDGKVINVLKWNDSDNPSIAGHVFIDVTAQTKPNVNDNYDGVNFTTPATTVIIPIPVRIITAWNFRKRLTQAERQTLSNSANATVKAIADDIKSMGDNVNLDDTDLKANFDALVAAGLITAARESIILQ